MLGVKLIDRVRNEVIREECGVKTTMFGHVEKMNERRLIKEIYEVDVGARHAIVEA
jgi:hypothetical protein